MSTDLRPIVCDNGSGFVKVGWAGSNFPSHIFPSMVGRPILRFEEDLKQQFQNNRIGSSHQEMKEIMVGDECSYNRTMLDISYPVDDGIVKKWDEMMHIYDYTFNERLHINSPSEHRILLTEPPLNPSNNRKQMYEVMLEKYGKYCLSCGAAAR